MLVEKIIIEVDKNDKELDSILDKLVKAKKLSKEQADQFRKDSKSFQEAAKKREKLLQEEIQDLTELKLRKRQAFSTEEINAYNKSIKESENRVKSLKESLGKSNQSLDRTEKLLGNIAKTALVAFSFQRIKSFADEASRLAGEFEGVQRAFSKLNDPNLLNDLRRATRNTISDLNLMKAAVRAENFKVPLDQLATFFEFATRRSIETGESVDYLVNSIVDGIGRKSTLVLDNLGISSTQLQNEFKKTGDFAKAVSNIIQQELSDSGDAAEDTAKIVDEQLTAAFDNLSVTIGTKLNPATSEFKQNLTGVINVIDQIIGSSAGFIDKILALSGNTGALKRVIVDNIKAEVDRRKAIDDTKKSVDNTILSEEEYLRLHKEEFDAFVKLNKSLKEQRELKDLIVEINEKIISQAKEDLDFTPSFTRTAEIEAATQAYRNAANEQERIAAGQLLTELINNQKRREAAEKLGDDLVDQALENDAKFADQFDQAQKDIDEKKRKAAEDERQRQQDAFDFERELTDKRFDLADSLVSALISLNKENAEAQKGLLLFEKLISIFRVIINGQAAAARARAELGPIAGEIAAQRINIITGLSVATIAAQTIPTLAFKEGVIDLQGPGTSTSDSIHARLSKGESVMTAKETAKHKEDLKAMRAKNWDAHIFHNYQLPFLKDFIIKNNINNEFNDRNLLDSQYRMRQELKGLRADLKKTRKHQLSVR